MIRARNMKTMTNLFGAYTTIQTHYSIITVSGKYIGASFKQQHFISDKNIYSESDFNLFSLGLISLDNHL